MTLYPIQNSFARGVLAPELHARPDLQQWQLALADALNFIPCAQAACAADRGTGFAGKAREQRPQFPGRLIPFQNDTQGYAIELSDQLARFFAMGGQVLNDGVPFYVITPWLQSQIGALNTAQSGDQIFATHPDVKPQVLSRFSETNWTIAPDDIQDGPYLDVPTVRTVITPDGRGNLAIGVATASNSEDVAHGADKAFDNNPATFWRAAAIGTKVLPVWLKADCGPGGRRVTGYMLQSDNESNGLSTPRSWTFQASNDDTTWVTLDARAGITGWGNSERRVYSFVNVESYRYYRIFVTDNNDSQNDPADDSDHHSKPVAIADLALQGDGGDGAILTLTASSTAGINDGAGFVQSDVGRHFRFYSSAAVWHWFVIQEVDSPTVVKAVLHSPPLPDGDSSSTWRLGAFSDTTGYPAFVCFYQNRKVYASTRAQPRRLWASRTQAFNDFSTSIPALDDDAIDIELPEGSIKWIAELETLVIGTSTALRSLGPADRTKGFSANNYTFGKPYWCGFEATQPVRCGDSLLAIGDFGKSLREVSSADGLPGYVAPDASVLSEHLLVPGVTWMAYARAPGSLVWMGMGDGSLVSLTYEKEQQMIAFAPHALGGAGIAESGCVIRGDGRHELWMLVYRQGVGRTVERMAADFKYLPAAEAYHVDCGLTYRGAPVTSVSGFDHLNGQTVQFWADGGDEAEQQVLNGSADLKSGQAAKIIHAGLGFRSFGRTLEIANGSPDGTLLGRRKNVRGVFMSLLDTAAARVRSYLSRNWESQLMRSFGDQQGVAVPLTTGNSKATTDSSWEKSGGQVEFESVRAGAMTIRAIIPKFDAEP